VSFPEEWWLMTSRERSSLDQESREILHQLRRLREVFELEIRSLESAGPGLHAPAWPAKDHDASLFDRRYERLLRLRRIHAKLHNRERVLSEGEAFGQE